MRVRLSKHKLAEIESPGRKYCPGCRSVLPLDKYYRDARERHGVSAYCQPCKRKRVRTRDPEEKRVRQRLYAAGKRSKYRALSLRLNHGLSDERFDEMLRQQNGLCAVCRKPELSKHQSGTARSLAVDHCHESGKIRGLLCSRCNPGIGYFLNSPELLRAAAEYLERNA